MAKDSKGGKAAKGKDSKSKAPEPEKKKGSKGGGDFARPSDAPATGDGWRFEDEKNVGTLFLITPLRTQTVGTKDYGDQEVVVADIVELHEKKPEKSELHEEVFIWGGWTKGATKAFIGEKKVLGRLAQDASKSKSKSPAWVLDDATPADEKIARAYMEHAKATADPFEQSKADKAKGKKSKK